MKTNILTLCLTLFVVSAIWVQALQSINYQAVVNVTEWLQELKGEQIYFEAALGSCIEEQVRHVPNQCRSPDSADPGTEGLIQNPGRSRGKRTG